MAKKVPGSWRLKIRPPNNSHIPVLKQFGFPRIFSRHDPAPSMGPRVEARASCAQKRRALLL